MPRTRYQEGTVEKTGTTPNKWNGRYAVYVIENGVERRKTKEKLLGLVSKMTKSEAKEGLKRLIEQDSGQNEDNRMTLAGWCNKYFTLRSPLWRPSWRKCLLSLYKCHFEPTALGKTALQDITRADCQEWLNERARTGMSQSLIHKCRTQLCRILEEAKQEDLVEKNRAELLEEPKSLCGPVLKPWLNLEQVGEALTAATGKDYLILRLAITRGLRPNEIFALRVDDVHDDRLMIDEGSIDGIIGETKTEGSAVPVLLSPDLRDELRAYIAATGKKGNDFLFSTSSGKPISQRNYVRGKMKKIGEEIRVPNLDFRMTRRTFATLFQKHTNSPKDLQSAMRHTSAEFSQRVYQQEIPESTARAVQSLEYEIMEAVG